MSAGIIRRADELDAVISDVAKNWGEPAGAKRFKGLREGSVRSCFIIFREECPELVELLEREQAAGRIEVQDE